MSANYLVTGIAGGRYNTQTHRLTLRPSAWAVIYLLGEPFCTRRMINNAVAANQVFDEPPRVGIEEMPSQLISVEDTNSSPTSWVEFR